MGFFLILYACKTVDSVPKTPTYRFEFEQHYIDTLYGGNGRPGWVRAGDMDNDGDLDIVAGGGEACFVYENDGSARGWKRHGSIDGTGAMGANGAVLLDVDQDGDCDIFSAKYYSDLGWWENPGAPLNSLAWEFHSVADEHWYLHDILLFDLDRDGKAEEMVVNLINKGMYADVRLEWLCPNAGDSRNWRFGIIEKGRSDGNNNHAGLDAGDLNGDGRIDLAYSNGWYAAPEDPDGTWRWHEVSAINGISNTLIRDINRDGQMDLVMSAGHHSKGVFWFEKPPDATGESWMMYTVRGTLKNP
jgi:hypothetical protein